MATIREMLERWQDINLQAIAGDAMSNHNQEITDLNREQMNEGYRADGTPITPKYKGFTIAEKQRKGQRWDVVTLRDTGAFQNKMETIIAGSKFTIISKDEKSRDLELKYGSIFGLTESGKKEAWLIVRPDVVKALKDETGSI